MNELLLAFIPMFFAMDPIGILAIFSGLTQGFSASERRRITIQSLVTATLLAVVFLFLGQAIFKLLGITMADFMIAGGIILFCLSMVDLLNLVEAAHKPSSLELGAVPIGTPLIVGPAVLTMELMLMNQYGAPIALASVLVNILIVALVLFTSETLNKMMGRNGSKILSKIMSLLLAAIGVMMVRRGIMSLFPGT